MRSTGEKILRWTVPPGVSIAVHAGLFGLIVLISSRIVALEQPEQRVPLSTLTVPAAPSAPATTPTIPDPPAEIRDLDSSDPFKSDEIRPKSLARDIAALGMSESKAPTMDPVSMAALSQSTLSATTPASTAPPTVRFAGVQSQAAQKIVYVVDGSGATAASFSSLQKQLLRSIDELSPTQRFQVVLFRTSPDGAVTHAPINGGRLAFATRGNKKAVNGWLDKITTRGRSNPVDGLRAALSLKPDLVLLITRSIQRTGDGAAWGGGRQQILAELNELNPRSSTTGIRRTVVKAIQLLDDDPTGVMQAIGSQHGDGADGYRVVSYEDLSRRDEPHQELDRRALGASDEQRLQTGAELLGTVTTPGILHAVLYGLPTTEQASAANDAAAQIDALVAPLVADNARAALLAANARLLLIHAGDPQIDLRQAHQTLNGAVFSDPIADANRRLLVAGMLESMGSHGEAVAMARSVLANEDDLQLDDLTRATALLALCSFGEEPDDLRTRRARPPFETVNGNLDPLWAILLAESQARGRIKSGAPNPWDPLVELRAVAKGNPQLERYIDAKMTSGVRWSSGEESAQVVRALADAPSAVILAAGNEAASDPETRLDAIALLQIVAERDEPSASPEALWRIGVIGRAHNTARTRKLAADALTALATGYPGHRLAGDALVGAIANAPTNEHNQRRKLLALALDRYPDRLEADLWRLELAGLIEDFARLDVLDNITPDTREGVLSGELYEQTILNMLTRYSDPSVRRALQSRMSDTAARLRLPSAPAWAQRAAASELAVDPDAAADRLTRLIREGEARGQDTGELKLLRARALIDAGKKSEAFGILNGIAARQDASDQRNDTYWQAWALMLETIAREGTEKDKSAARAHIARLKLVDPQLGRSPWKERITRASDALHSEP